MNLITGMNDTDHIIMVSILFSIHVINTSTGSEKIVKLNFGFTLRLFIFGLQ